MTIIDQLLEELVALRREVEEMHEELAGIRRRLDTPNPSTVWPDRMTVEQARIYAGEALGRERPVSRQTIYDWIRSGRLTDIQAPRRVLREEVDQVARGCLGRLRREDEPGRRGAARRPSRMVSGR